MRNIVCIMIGILQNINLNLGNETKPLFEE